MKYKAALFTALIIAVVNTINCRAITVMETDTIRVTLNPFLPTDFEPSKVNIFLDGLYRGDEPSDFAHMLNEDWYNLSPGGFTDEFILEKAQITVAKEFDDCLGDSSTYVTSRDDAIVMIKGITQKNRTVKNLITETITISLDEKQTFTLNNIEYTLKADGIYTDENNVYMINGYELRNSHNDILNYRLYLYTKDKKQMLLSVPRTNDTFVQVLFIGDLDEDGIPDFIFDTSRDYEEKRVTLFLSSPAKYDNIVEPVDEASYQFDC